MIQSENTWTMDKSGTYYFCLSLCISIIDWIPLPTYYLFLNVIGQDDEFIENGLLKKVDKNNVKGKKRKKCLRDKTAPRPPHSGN